MSDRDELAELSSALRSEGEMASRMGQMDRLYDLAESVDALWAAGWRKKPTKAELIAALSEPDTLIHDSGQPAVEFGLLADAILALMDGPTETGEK